MESTFNIEALPVKITYVGETVRDNNWQCDQWRVEISYRNDKGTNFWNTDYFTGLGHRVKPKQVWAKATPKRPKVADVLHSLFLDASAADQNFADWCCDYGYSDDSISALNTYKACLETAAMLRRAFDAETRKQIEAIISEM